MSYTRNFNETQMQKHKIVSQKVLHKLESLLSPQEVSLNKQNVAELLSNIFCPGLSYFFILDVESRKILHIDDNVSLVHNISPEDFSINSLLKWLHPSDREFAIACEAKILDFLYRKIPREHICDYKTHYTFRLKHREGHYALILHQGFVLSLNEEGQISKIFIVHSDISHLTLNNTYKVSFLGVKGRTSYYNLDVLEDKAMRAFHPFTRRELDILRLIAEGNTTQDISVLLNISPDTVSTHRRNALAKTNCKNVTELIVKVVRKGWI